MVGWFLSAGKREKEKGERLKVFGAIRRCHFVQFGEVVKVDEQKRKGKRADGRRRERAMGPERKRVEKRLRVNPPSLLVTVFIRIGKIRAVGGVKR